MPCNDGGGPSYDQEQLNKAQLRLDFVTNLLCSVMSRLGGNELSKHYQSQIPGLKTWWEDHQAYDAGRRARERAAEQRAIAKASALKKLTRTEREILGL